MSTPRDLLNAAREGVREMAPHEVAARLDSWILLDVREPDEYEQGSVPGAVHIPRGMLEFSVEGRLSDKGASRSCSSRSWRAAGRGRRGCAGDSTRAGA